MTFSILLLVGSATALVLNRIQSTTLAFSDEQCGNVTGTFVSGSPPIDECLTVASFSATVGQCIPNAATNCLIKGQQGNANFTAEDADIRFQWLCGADNSCGITTTDTNSTGGFLGTIRTGTTGFRTTPGVVGFIESGGSASRKIRGAGLVNTARVVDKRVEYTFFFDACSENATSTD